MEMVFAGIAFVAPILGIIFVITALVYKKKNNRCSAQTDGILLDIVHNSESVSSYIYSYSVNGVDYKGALPGKSPDAKNIGDHCTIWYNPAKPKDAMAYHYKTNKLLNILLIVGLVLFIFPILLMISRRTLVTLVVS